jgi:hypothetical protein
MREGNVEPLVRFRESITCDLCLILAPRSEADSGAEGRIPAHAGEGFGFRNGTHGSQVAPRERGRRVVNRDQITVDKVGSPRARAKGLFVSLLMIRTRRIPASAGEWISVLIGSGGAPELVK